MTQMETLAKAGMESMFCEKWDDFAENSIDRAIWLQVADAMLKALGDHVSEATKAVGAGEVDWAFENPDARFSSETAVVILQAMLMSIRNDKPATD